MIRRIDRQSLMSSLMKFVKKATKTVVDVAKTLKVRTQRLLKPLSERFAGHDGRGVKFRPTACFAIYFVLLLFSIFFTQALRSSVSAVIMLFMIFLPILGLIYLFVGTLAVKIYTTSEYTEVQKGTPLDFSLTVGNSSPIPFPFVDAMISTPSDNAVRCQKRLTRLSLIPFGNYEIKKTISFAYRGGYTIGVSDVYISDPLRMFCYRMDVNLSREIFVLPARPTLSSGGGERLDSDVTETVNRHFGADNTELADIRDYVAGDSLRAIHWKLSSKTEELQVRQYAKNSEKQTIVICDNAVRYENDPEKYADDINEFVADGMIESAIAIVDAALAIPGGAAALIWFDDRVPEGYLSARLDSPAAFDEIYRLFATAPTVKTESEIGVLLDLVSGAIDHATVSIVGGRLTPSLAASLSGVSLRGSVASEFYTFIPSEKIADSEKSAYFDALDGVSGELARRGIRVLDARDGRISGRAVNTVKKDAKEDVSDE